MGNRYCSTADEFDWNVGAKRRLRRYLQSGLTYTEIGLLLGVSRGAVAGATYRFHLQYGAEVQREYQARQAWERAQHGKRANSSRYWDNRLIETWVERKARLAREIAA